MSAHIIDRSSTETIYSQINRSLESKGKPTNTKILGQLVVPASGGVSRRLGITNGDPVICIETLRQGDNIPFCIVSHFIPQKELEPIETNYNGGSLHRFIKERLALKLRRTDSLITAVLPQNMPVLWVKSLNVDAHTNSPMKHAVTRFRSDRIQLAVNL